MPAIKPGVSYDWARLPTALKLNPSTKVLEYGWTTSNDLISGVPQKPILQYENGWKYGVYQWIGYLEEKTDETISLTSATGQAANYFLKTDGLSFFTWAQINQVPITGQTANYFLKATDTVNYSWQPLRQVSPNGNADDVLAMTSGSTYGWQAFAPSGSFATTATMTFVGTGTATLGTGNDRLITYKKVGNLVTFNAYLLVTATSSIVQGETRINGLPFASIYDTAVNISIDGIPFLDFTVQARIKANTNYINLFKFEYGDTVPLSSGIPSGASNFRISLSGSYIVA